MSVCRTSRTPTSALLQSYDCTCALNRQTYGSPQLRSSDCARSHFTGSRGMSSPSLSQWFGKLLHVGDGDGFRRNCGLGEGRYLRLLLCESLECSLSSSLKGVGDLLCGESCKVPLPCCPLSPFLPEHFAHLPFLPFLLLALFALASLAITLLTLALLAKGVLHLDQTGPDLELALLASIANALALTLAQSSFSLNICWCFSFSVSL